MNSSARKSDNARNVQIPIHNREDFLRFVRGLLQVDGRTTIQRINHLACKRDPSFAPHRFAARGLRSLLVSANEFELEPLKDFSGRIVDYEVRSRGLTTDAESGTTSF